MQRPRRQIARASKAAAVAAAVQAATHGVDPCAVAAIGAGVGALTDPAPHVTTDDEFLEHLIAVANRFKNSSGRRREPNYRPPSKLVAVDDRLALVREMAQYIEDDRRWRHHRHLPRRLSRRLWDDLYQVVESVACRGIAPDYRLKYLLTAERTPENAGEVAGCLWGLARRVQQQAVAA